VRAGNRGNLHRQVVSRFTLTATANAVAVFFKEFSQQKQFSPQRRRGRGGKAEAKKCSRVRNLDWLMIRRRQIWRHSAVCRYTVLNFNFNFHFLVMAFPPRPLRLCGEYFFRLEDRFSAPVRA
jgi:hypothetical protein